MSRRGRDLTDPELRGRNLFGGDSSNFGGSGLNENYTPYVDEDNLKDYENKTGEFAPNLYSRPTGRETQRPSEWTINTDDEEEPYVPTNRGSGDPVYNKPTSTPTPIKDTHHDAHEDTHTHSENNTHNIVTNNNRSYNNGQDEDAPTYEGKHNRASKIGTKVVDALGDAMTKYLLHKNNRRQLLNVNADINKYIDGATFAMGMMKDPMGTAIKGAVGLTKNSLDGIEGQNVFEMLSRQGILSIEEEKEIGIKEMGLFRKKESIAKSHFGTDENGDIYLKTAQDFLKDKIDGTFSHSKPNRMVLNDSMKEEMVFIKNPVIMPFVIITIALYYALHHKGLNIDDYHSSFSVVDAVVEKGIKIVLKDVLKLDDITTTFALDTLTTMPQELITAFIRNIDSKVGLTNDERNAVDDYTKGIINNYKRLYKEPLDRALKHFQGNNMPLYQLLTELGSDDVLHNLAVELKTADAVLWEAVNNKGLFLGLIELTSIHNKGLGDMVLSKQDIGNDYYVNGIVRYLGKPNNIKRLEDVGLNSLVDLERNGGKLKIEGTNDVGLYKNGNDYIVAIKGTKNKQDLLENFENVAGSSDFLETDRYKDADALITKAQRLADRSGGNAHLVGYSLGGTIAGHLATKHQSVKTDVYEPVIPNNAQTKKMLEQTKHSNVLFHKVNNSAISEKLLEFQRLYGFPLKSYNQKRHSSHTLTNFV